MFKIKTIILFFVILIHLNTMKGELHGRIAGSKCSRRNELQIDYTLSKLLVFGQKKVQFPETAQAFRPFCNEALRLFDAIMQYTKECLNKFGKDASAVLLHGINVELKHVCKPGRLNRKAKELLGAARCANKGNEAFTGCYYKWIDKYMGITSVEKKLRIPMSCCNFHEFVRCMTAEAEEVSICTPKTIDFLHHWVYKTMDGVLQMFCMIYDESNGQCDTIVSNTPVRNETEKRFKSIFMPLIGIAMSLGEEELPTK